MLLPTVIVPTALVAALLDRSRSVCALRADGAAKVVGCNLAFARVVGQPVEALAGVPVAELLTRADAATLVAHLEAGEATSLLLNWVGPSQEPVTLACVAARDSEGFVVVGETARVEEEALGAELLQLNNQLAVANRENIRKGRELTRALAELREARVALVQSEKMASLGIMAAGIAHEVNNPIAFVRANHETLQRDFEDLLSFVNVIGDSLEDLRVRAPAVRDALLRKAGQIELEHLSEAVSAKLASNVEGLDRVAGLVRDLRTYSRIDEATVKAVDLAEGLDATVRFLGPLLRERGVSIVVNRQAGEPLVCNPSALNQVFANLLTNAVQASPTGGVVRVDVGGNDAQATVDVRDDGCGIDPANLARVFDPFFTTKPVGTGTGLGLSIAQRVVGAHGGRITIESTLGAGTTVRVVLPRQSPLADSASPAGKDPS